MRWFKRSSDPVDSSSAEVPDVVVCARCGSILDGGPDETFAGGAALPLCGECERTRNFEADLTYLDANDGSLDGDVDW